MRRGIGTRDLPCVALKVRPDDSLGQRPRNTCVKIRPGSPETATGSRPSPIYGFAARTVAPKCSMGSLFDEFPGRWPGLTSGRTVGAAKQDALDGTRRIVYNMAHKLHLGCGCAPALPERQDCRCAAVDLSQFGEGKRGQRAEVRGSRSPHPACGHPLPVGEGF